MDFKELVKKNRSYRRFYQDYKIGLEILKELAGLTRFTPSAANRQPLRFILSNNPEKNALIFRHLAWAAYLAGWNGPDEGERPSAYIVVLNDSNISKTIGCDYGIAAQTMLLGATEKGLGGCMIASIKKEELKQALNIPDNYEILLAVALGRPKEIVVIDDLAPSGDVRYWRDEQKVHHVPKRTLDELILNL
jgi:nitroreductase